MNDICNVSHLCTILYADDKLLTWLKNATKSLNVNKTHNILCHRARIKLPDAFLNVYKSNSTQVECMDLGVILDSKMSWAHHIT